MNRDARTTAETHVGDVLLDDRGEWCVVTWVQNADDYLREKQLKEPQHARRSSQDSNAMYGPTTGGDA